MTDEIPTHQDNGAAAPLEEPKAAPVIRFDRGVGAAQVWMSAFLIVAVGVIAYSNILGIPFHAEDRELIVDNAPLHSLTTFPDAVNPDDNPRVLTMVSYALNWKVAPGSSAAFHVVNLLLHLANGVLVFLVCRALLGPSVSPVIPMVAGMLFAVHPLNTESVDYVVGRAGLLSAFFALVSVLLFLRGARAVAWEGEAPAEPGGAGLGLPPVLWTDIRAALSVFAYVLAWGADSSVIMLPALILAADWVVSGRRLFRRLGVHAAFWGVLFALLAVQYAAGVRGPGLLGKQAAFAYLVLLALAPLNLSVIHAAPVSSAALVAVPFAIAVFAALLLLMRSPAGVGLLWFLVGLWCAGGKDPAERNAYLGLAGLAMLVPWLMTVLKPPSLRAVGGLVAAGLVIAAGTGTYMRNLVWRDELTLWGDAVKKAPDSPLAARNLGRAFLNLRKSAKSGDSNLFSDGYYPVVLGISGSENGLLSPLFAQNAEENLRRSLSLDPSNVQARSDLAMAIVRQGRTDEAIPLFLDVLRSDIENQQAALNVALLLNDKANASGDQDLLVRSVDYFRRADGLKPLTDEPLARYGMALLALGEWEEAEGALQRAVGGDSESPLASVLKNSRETLKAVRGMEQQSLALLAKDPSDISGLKMRAQIYALRGQALQSAYVLERLWRENRQDFATWVLMGYVKANMKEAEEFIKDYPLPAKPAEVKSAWTEVARACASRGLWDAAKAYLESPGAGAEDLGPALLVLADIAQEVRQGPRAQEYLEQATRAYPSDPRPWLRLCDMAAPVNASAAARYLSEAQARGADAAEAGKRKEKLGGVAVEPAEPGRTIIR